MDFVVNLHVLVDKVFISRHRFFVCVCVCKYDDVSVCGVCSFCETKKKTQLFFVYNYGRHTRMVFFANGTKKQALEWHKNFF